MELQDNLERLRAQGLGVAAISYDSEAVLKSFAERKGITYPLLSDPESAVIRAYGLFNETVPRGMAYGIPHPGTLILDAKGAVVSKYFEEDYRQRYTAADILVREYGAGAGGTAERIETKHLTVLASASPATVHVGQRVALVLELELKPKMHVYAPGVQGYIPVDWKVAGTAAWKVHEPAYPAPVKLHLKAIKETVPVYEKKVKLRGEVTIGAEAQVKPLLDSEGMLTVESGFRYQACDDKTCYVPQTVPVKFRLKYEAMDRERAPEELRRK